MLDLISPYDNDLIAYRNRKMDIIGNDAPYLLKTGKIQPQTSLASRSFHSQLPDYMAERYQKIIPRQFTSIPGPV